MDNNPAAPPAPLAPPPLAIKIFGVGDAAITVIERLITGGLPPSLFVAVNAGAKPPASCAAAEKLHLETKSVRGTDPERSRAMAEEHASRLQSLCAGANAIFIVAGLGGSVGTGISPVLARVAKESGALVLAFVTTPFPCEANHRRQLARQGLEALKTVADGVICLPSEKIMLQESTTVLETYQLADQLLADGILGIWRLLTLKGLLDIHFDDLCALIRERHAESAFAVAEAVGATRSREVLDKLFAHPLLENGETLAHSDAVLVSLMGGPDLAMAEVNRVMDALNAKCAHAQVIMGAAIDETFRERLALTLIASRAAEDALQRERPAGSAPGELHSQLLERDPPSRPNSRFVPPPPALPPEQVEQMLARQRSTSPRPRKMPAKLRQTQLPLEIISKGRFDKSEPTIHKGEDLDVPTYVRRGVSLN